MPSAVPEKIACTSEQHLKEELATCQDVLALPETEDSWEKLSRAISRLTALIKGGAHKYPHALVNGVKSLSRHLLSAMNSERTRLSATVLELLMSLAPRLDRHFEPLMPMFLPAVLKLCTRTNKLYIARARAFLDTLTDHTTLTSMIPYLQGHWDDKSNTLRVAAADTLIAALKKFNPPDLSRYIAQIETAIKSTGVDKDPAVRTAGRKMFECYKVLWPDRVESFIAPMSPITRRYLDIPTRQRTISVLAETRDPLSISVPGSQAAARPGLRRSLSLDDLNELQAPKLDRRIRVPEREVTKVVPVRRAARPMKKEEPMLPPLPFKSQEEPLPPAPPRVPTLSRAISMAQLRNQPVQDGSGSSTTQLDSKGPRRVIQTTLPPIPPPTRSGPSRPDPATSSLAKQAAPPSEHEPVTIVQPANLEPDAPPKGNGERRGQGAQRIAILPPHKPQPRLENPEKKDGSSGLIRPAKRDEKPESFKPHSRTGRVELKTSTSAKLLPSSSRERSVVRSDHTSKDSRPTSRAESSRPNSRLQSRMPISKAGSSKATSSLVPSEDKPKEIKPAPVRRGLTAPTRAQLARAKALEDDRDKVKRAAVSTRGAAAPTRGFIPVRGRGQSRSGVSRPPRKEEPIPEAQVPLPSSPKMELVLPVDLEREVHGVNALEPLGQPAQKSFSAVDAVPEIFEHVDEEECASSHPVAVSEEQLSPTETSKQTSGEKMDSTVGPSHDSNQGPRPVQESAQAMSELDRLLFSSPMRTFVFEPPHASSPVDQAKPEPNEPQDGAVEAPEAAADEPSKLLLRSVSEPVRDPYASLPFFLKEALLAPIPPTPNARPSPFMRFETDDTIISSSRRHEEESGDDTMDKLEFAVNGVDPFGRIIYSPSKRQTVARDALIDLSVNQ